MSVTVIFHGDTASNQHSDVCVQSSAHGYWHMRNSGYKVSVQKPVIDRLAVTYPVDDNEVREGIRTSLNLCAISPDEKSFEYAKAASFKHSNRYQLSVDFVATNGHRALIQCDPKKGQSSAPFFRVELFPGIINKQGVKELNEALHYFSLGNIEYSNLVKYGKVTRLDIAVDLVNIGIDQMVLSTAKLGKTIRFYGLTDKLETVYLAAKKGGGSRLYAYDRRQRMLDCDSEPEHGETPCTRIEVQTKSQKPIVELPELSNRLDVIDVRDLAVSEYPEEEYHWSLFEESCRYRGVDGALSFFPEDVRNSYVAALANEQSEIWRSDKLWSYWPEVVEKSGLLQFEQQVDPID
jgi:hypothetical protein